MSVSLVSLAFGAMARSAMAEDSVGQGSDEAPIPYVDLHVDLAYQHGYHERPFERGSGQFPESLLGAGGVSRVILPLFIPKTVSKEGPRLQDLSSLYQEVMVRLTASQTYLLPGQAKKDGRVATWLAIEGSGMLVDQPELVKLWAERGVRLFGLVHADDNVLSSSATGRTRNTAGLTEAGERFVRAVYDAGALIDVSHASDRAALETIALAKAAGRPVIASHSNARALLAHPRNLPDTILDGIAETGGLIGINFHSPFLRRGGRATTADVVRHIRYVADRVGASHVAIGSDFEGGIVPAVGLEHVDRVQSLGPALRAAGFSDAEIAGILGANAERVLSLPKPVVQSPPAF
jgi:membrane dipeptidase